MTRELEGRIALVTGGSRGIGRAICQALAEKGATVAVNYVSKPEAANEVVKAIAGAGGKAVLAQFDVSDDKAAAAGVQKVGEELGGLDILVNNAGVAINGLLMRFSTEQWEKVLRINLGGAFHCTKAASRYLLKSKTNGRIINVTSVVGEMGNAGQAGYAASKAGLIGFTKSMARELASRGVTVNAVAPGYIETDMTAAELPEAQRDKFLQTIPLSRVGKPEEVASVVAFLAGPGAAYITGEVVRVNGGLLI